VSISVTLCVRNNAKTLSISFACSCSRMSDPDLDDDPEIIALMAQLAHKTQEVESMKVSAKVERFLSFSDL
jgi:hypothetical protein